MLNNKEVKFTSVLYIDSVKQVWGLQTEKEFFAPVMVMRAPTGGAVHHSNSSINRDANYYVVAYFI